MHVFDVPGDPVRRRILELLVADEHSAGAIVAVVQGEFGLSQAAVSQHLRVLREGGFARVRVDGPRRVYSFEPEPLRELDGWLEQFRSFGDRRLSALRTGIAQGRRDRRHQRT